jgi:hypothetical protein
MQDGSVEQQQQQLDGSIEQQQRAGGGVGLGGVFDMLMGSVSYDRTLKVWAPEEGLPDIIGDSSDSGSEGDDGSEAEEDGLMELG